ncbi:MAG: hypothetical protein ACK5XX_01200 [Holosporales bacterium]|jgi:hypothetical protein|nr:hypothetical protein [Thalassospira sp.]
MILNMPQLSTDPIIKKIDLGFFAVGNAAIEKARQTKTKLVIWRDGKVIEIEPEEADADERPT